MTATKFSFIYCLMPGINGKYLRTDNGWDESFNPQTSWFGVDSGTSTAEGQAILIATTLATQGITVAVGVGYANGAILQGTGTTAPTTTTTPPSGTWVPLTTEFAQTLDLAGLIAFAQQKYGLTAIVFSPATVFESDAEYMEYLVSYLTEGGENVILVDDSH